MQTTIEQFPEPMSPLPKLHLRRYTATEREATEFSISESPDEKVARIALSALIDIQRFEESANTNGGSRLKESGHFNRLMRAKQTQLDWYSAEFNLDLEKFMLNAKSLHEVVQQVDVDTSAI